MKILSPCFEANCLFGWLNVNLGMNLTGYSYICANEGKSWIAALTLGNHEVFIDHYSTNPRWISPGLVDEFFEYCFSLKPKCVAHVAADNFRQRRMCERLGFMQEGILRRAFDGSRDSVYYGLLMEDWEKSKYRRK